MAWTPHQGSICYLAICQTYSNNPYPSVDAASKSSDGAVLSLDSRLAQLQNHGQLYEVAREVLKSYTRQILRRQIQSLVNQIQALVSFFCLTKNTSAAFETRLVEFTSLESLLLNYQCMISTLLGMHIYSGLSLQQLERFKQEFRTSAFICSVWPCPRAAMGFDSYDLRIAHEVNHRRTVCKIQGCQYPPFHSIRGLAEHHHVQCHDGEAVNRKRTTIRTTSSRVSRGQASSSVQPRAGLTGFGFLGETLVSFSLALAAGLFLAHIPNY